MKLKTKDKILLKELARRSVRKDEILKRLPTRRNTIEAQKAYDKFWKLEQRLIKPIGKRRI